MSNISFHKIKESTLANREHADLLPYWSCLNALSAAVNLGTISNKSPQTP